MSEDRDQSTEQDAPEAEDNDVEAHSHWGKDSERENLSGKDSERENLSGKDS